MDSIHIKEKFPVKPEVIYNTWLNSELHAAMIAGDADIKPEEGYQFSMWDGYISGMIISLVPNREMILSWRADEFDEDAPDSNLDIFLEEENGATIFRLEHYNIPEELVEDYKQGWEDYYLVPMREYFTP